MESLKSLVVTIGSKKYTLKIDMDGNPMFVAYAQCGNLIDVFKRSLPSEWKDLTDDELIEQASQLQQSTISFDTRIRDAGLSILDDGTYHFEYSGSAEDIDDADDILAETLISPRISVKSKRHTRALKN